MFIAETTDNAINGGSSTIGTAQTFRFALSNGLNSTNVSSYVFGGATFQSFKHAFGPKVGTVLSVDRSFSHVLIAQPPVTEGTSGTHPLLSTFAIKPLVITNGTAGTTNAATLYIEGAATGTATPSNNYALWVDDGAVQIDDTLTVDGALTATLTGTATGLAGTPSITINALTTTGTIDIGHADQNTLSGSGGVLSIQGVAIPTISSTNTLTNKRVTLRVTTEASSATPTINSDNSDMHSITALAAAITSMTTNLTGTPTNGQKLLIRILDNGTPRVITWGADFRDAGVPLPIITTTSKLLTVGLIYDTVTGDWGCVAAVNET